MNSSEVDLGYTEGRRMAGGFPCCCEPGGSSTSTAPPAIPCENCLPGTSPREYQVDIAGIRNAFTFLCTQCANLNGSYVLSQFTACEYRLSIPPVCGFDRLQLAIAPAAYQLSIVSSTGSTSSLAFRATGVTSPRDCRVVNLSLPRQGATSNCSHTVATCRLTAL